MSQREISDIAFDETMTREFAEWHDRCDHTLTPGCCGTYSQRTILAQAVIKWQGIASSNHADAVAKIQRLTALNEEMREAKRRAEERCSNAEQNAQNMLAKYNETIRALAASAEEGKPKRDDLSGNPFNPAFNYYRASGDAICSTCGQRYGDHPTTRAKERWHYGVELFVLCNTDRVKT